MIVAFGNWTNQSKITKKQEGVGEITKKATWQQRSQTSKITVGVEILL